MPWTADSFREKHNKKLSKSDAAKAAKIANAMLERGVPEDEAIATANKHVRPMHEKLYPVSSTESDGG